MEIQTEENLYKKVEEAINSIRPYLNADGGDVNILEITDDKHLKIELTGTCESCPMSAMTLKAGIQEAVKKAVPEIIKVDAVNI